MAEGNNRLERLLAEKIEKNSGILVPVKASAVERRFTKYVHIDKLHPNPDDEFCSPSIGPNYGIISNYESTFRRYGSMLPGISSERLIVQKVYPDGYMILNGHHRWAAALAAGITKIPVELVNLTQEIDIEKMIARSTHDKRVGLDLDETVFCTDDSTPAEKPLPRIYRKYFPERLRLGIPALMHYLSKAGYDIWVYSSEYYSLEYIRKFFERYSVKVDGIITGTARKISNRDEAARKTQRLFDAKYNETLHIDPGMILRTKKDKSDFEEYALDPTSEKWSRDVMRTINKIVKDEKKDQNR